MSSAEKKVIKKEIEFAGRKLSLEYGEVAGQANGAVLARYGETVILAAVTTSDPKEEITYFPLTVDYIERLYAGGRIKASRFVKREGKPSDDAIIAGRMVDRVLRPLFPKEFKKEVQVVVTLLSVDMENDPALLGLVGASAALACSDIPWNGPAAVVRVGWNPEADGAALILNPRESELAFSELDLVVAGTETSVVMVEAGAKEVPEEAVLEAVNFGQKEMQPLIGLIKDLAKEVGCKKADIEKDPEAEKLVRDIRDFSLKKVKKVVSEVQGKEEQAAEIDLIKEELFKKFEGTYAKVKMVSALDDLKREAVRELVLKDGKRPDGRKMDEVRPIRTKVGLLPRTHGSALFQRGATQVLTIATLGSTSLEQLIEGPTGEETKRFIHHYYFPPFSVGETGRIGAPKRREIGHSALAERALLPMIPSEEKFPYAIRLVSEVLSSNGSTSMAATCGSTLSLMDAGVPIKAPVSGIAMGLFKDEKKTYLLTDITGLEDQCGDMDFKVAGTEKGITALQMDIKATGLSHKTMVEALDQAKEARLFILGEMLNVIGKPRESLSDFAPKVETLKIPVKKIGQVIGPGGKTIKGIIEKTGTAIDVQDDGTVTISAVDREKVSEAKKTIDDLTRDLKVGEVLEGEVKRITDFGAFVEILPGREGLVHVSELSHEFVDRVDDILKVGDKIKVKVIKVDDEGKISLSKKALAPRSSHMGHDGGSVGRKPRKDDGRRTRSPGYRTPDWRRSRRPRRSASRR
jgi:polyribonucleotide nucleotidyltransferase